MDGLDVILETISARNGEKREKVLATYSEKAKIIYETAVEKAKKECVENIKKAEEEAEKIIAFAYFEAKSKTKIKKLDLKRELLDEVIKSVEEKILSLPDSDYFSLMYRQLSTVGKIKDGGVITFNKRDKNRLPKDFFEKIKRNTENITVSEKCVDIQGGFILDVGKIRYNFSIEALKDDKYDELTDEISKVLFNGGDTEID